jgi:hypothetical protein
MPARFLFENPFNPVREEIEVFSMRDFFREPRLSLSSRGGDREDHVVLFLRMQWR